MTENNPPPLPDKSQQFFETINSLNLEQLYAYWQQQTEILRKKQQNIRRQSLHTGQFLPFLEPLPSLEKYKLFDCVEMKQKAVQHILEKINKMTTIEEELAYWQQSTDKLRSNQQAFRRQTNK